MGTTATEGANMYRDSEIDFIDFSDFVDEIYGNTNPDCPGHEIAEGENSRVVWCDFADECPEA
jgi:hypothetical protein